MRFGACVNPDCALLAKECGYDFIEYQLRETYEMSEEEMIRVSRLCEESGIRIEAMNCMLPSSLRVTGPQVDLVPIRDYLEKSVARAAQLGCETIVFGSAWSRDMPEGFSDKNKALAQLVEYLHIASDICGKYGIAIAIEPLGGTNIITFISEGHHLIHLTERENVRLLADLYAMSCVHESCEDIVAYAEHFEHLHFCSPIRKFPVMNDSFDYSTFFEAVKRSGFDKRISLEAESVTGDLRRDLLDAMSVMRHYLP